MCLLSIIILKKWIELALFFLWYFMIMNQLNRHNQILSNVFDSFSSTLDLTILNDYVCLDSIDAVLRKYLSREEMRNTGSFFTGQKLASLVINKVRDDISLSSVVLDPTCGAGNLLIECSRSLQVCNTLSETLKAWGRVLRGYDLQSQFVDAAKVRIVLEALNRGVQLDCDLNQAISYLNEIRVVDALTITPEQLEDVTHVLMNPPFTNCSAPLRDFWKKGNVNLAGVIFDFYLRILPEKCKVSAILPDVLRSGTRYTYWREFVQSKVNSSLEIYGRFNTKTDIDVFILDGIIEKNEKTVIWYEDNQSIDILSIYYDVCIGPLVAYRDPEEGTLYPYIDVKNANPWQVVTKFIEYRRYKGKSIQGPFVVIRRTSSPSQKYRLVPTIIKTKDYVAVENHLIVIKPKDNKISSCNRLLMLFKTQNINNYLNDRIRCRHLTVGAIKAIPM